MYRAYIRCYTLLQTVKKYGVTPVLTFDQPLWINAQHILDAESSTSRIKYTVLRLEG